MAEIEEETRGLGTFMQEMHGNLLSKAFPQLSSLLRSIDSHFSEEKAVRKASGTTSDASSSRGSSTTLKGLDVVVEAIQDSMDIVHQDIKMTNIILSSSLEEQMKMTRMLDKILMNGGAGGGNGNGSGSGGPSLIDDAIGLGFLGKFLKGLPLLAGRLSIFGTALSLGGDTNKPDPTKEDYDIADKAYKDYQAKQKREYEAKQFIYTKVNPIGGAGGDLANAMDPIPGVITDAERARNSIKKNYQGNELADEQKRETERGQSYEILTKINANLEKIKELTQDEKDSSKLKNLTGDGIKKDGANLYPNGSTSPEDKASSMDSLKKSFGVADVPVVDSNGNTQMMPQVMATDYVRTHPGSKLGSGASPDSSSPSMAIPRLPGRNQGPGVVPQENSSHSNYPTISGSNGAGKKAAEDYLGRPINDQEYNELVRATAAESTSNPKEQGMIMASILNRARTHPGGIIGALHAPNQFQSVTGTRFQPGPSANFTNGPNANRLASIENSASSYLPYIPHDQKDFTAASSAAYGPGTNIGYRDNMIANGGMRIGGTIFNSSMNLPKSSQNTFGKPDFGLGDSTIAGLNLSGDAKVGRNPSDTLKATEEFMKHNDVKGKHVVISSISNDPSQAGFENLQKQAMMLKNAGATVSILGGGSRPDIAAWNDKIKKFSDENNIGFVPMGATGADRVHPKNYGNQLHDIENSSISATHHPAFPYTATPGSAYSPDGFDYGRDHTRFPFGQSPSYPHTKTPLSAHPHGNYPHVPTPGSAYHDHDPKLYDNTNSQYSNGLRDMGINARARDMHQAQNIQAKMQTQQNALAAALHQSSQEDAFKMRAQSNPPLVNQFNNPGGTPGIDRPQKTKEHMDKDHVWPPVAPPNHRLSLLFRQDQYKVGGIGHQ